MYIWKSGVVRMVFYRFLVRKIPVVEKDNQKLNAHLYPRFTVKNSKKEWSPERDPNPGAVNP